MIISILISIFCRLLFYWFSIHIYYFQCIIVLAIRKALVSFVFQLAIWQIERNYSLQLISSTDNNRFGIIVIIPMSHMGGTIGQVLDITKVKRTKDYHYLHNFISFKPELWVKPKCCWIEHILQNITLYMYHTLVACYYRQPEQ